MEEGRSTKLFIGKLTKNRSLGRPRSSWEGNIIMDFKEVGVNTSYSAQIRDYWKAVVNAALNLRVHKLWNYLRMY